MSYDSVRFLDPPRANRALARDALRFYERRPGWWAQHKYNGTYVELIVAPESGLAVAYDRHGSVLKSWQPREGWDPFWKRLPNGFWVLCAELLHSKVAGGPRDTLYFHDVLVAAGNHLVGCPYKRRYPLLCEVLEGDKQGEERHGHRVIGPNAWIARNYHAPFVELYDAIKSMCDPIDEGLVLKNSDSPLTVRNGDGWSVKSRFRRKNFSQ